jgi:hypothetical protein
MEARMIRLLGLVCLAFLWTALVGCGNNDKGRKDFIPTTMEEIPKEGPIVPGQKPKRVDS